MREVAQPPRPVPTTNKCIWSSSSRQSTGLPRRRMPKPSALASDSRSAINRAGVQRCSALSKLLNAIRTSGALSRSPANQAAAISELWLAASGASVLACADGVSGGMGISPPADLTRRTVLASTPANVTRAAAGSLRWVACNKEMTPTKSAPIQKRRCLKANVGSVCRRAVMVHGNSNSIPTDPRFLRDRCTNKSAIGEYFYVEMPQFEYFYALS